MSEILVLDPCHCGAKKLMLAQISDVHFEVRCTKCMDFVWGNTPDFAVKRWNESQMKEENPNMSTLIPKTTKDCCNHSMNLIKENNGNSDKCVMVCRICGCRHIRFKTDPGRIFSKG